MARLLLVRHGETDWNLRRIWQGHADAALNETGRAQARALAERLAGVRFDAAYASDLSRAHATAVAILAGRDLELRLETGLREIDVGEWAGLTRAEIRERWPDGACPGGEDVEAFRARVVAAVTRIAAAHEGESVLVVTHGGCIRSVQRAILGEPLPVLENCAAYAVAYRGGALAEAADALELAAFRAD